MKRRTALTTLLLTGTLLATAAPAGAQDVGADRPGARAWTVNAFPAGNANIQDAGPTANGRTAWAVGFRQFGKGRETSTAPVAFARDGARGDWTELALPDGLSARSVEADGAGATWATGLKYGTATGIPTARYQGGRWQVQDAPAPARSLAAGINGIAAAGGPDDVWAAGYYQPDDILTFLGLIEHWNGTSWEQVEGPRIDSDYWTLRDVVATGPSDVWAVGEIGTPEGWPRPLLLHYDGRSWNRVAVPDLDSRFGELTQLVAVGPNDIWASGTDTGMSRTDDHALVVHYDGRGWSSQETGIGAGQLNGLTRVAGGVAVVGAAKEGGRFRPVGARLTAHGWQPLDIPQGTAPQGRIPRAVMELGGRLTVVGSDLLGKDENGEPLPSMPFSVTR
ncbi:hypothetical protein [Kitasatospora cheerisanensis]|uniref:LigA protein n=1 Tax=Kitasatospora cheerisanensis KCTC 2395 TaxID=1348663 RepID=A0A066YRY2_9ACTN|nr:hypothetical protein [Kitasatospora cheerisanensis]KDN84313.1 hypothetical protein KCH_41040 [Kitasatospora cheerisanensis KCTC 2395]